MGEINLCAYFIGEKKRRKKEEKKKKTASWAGENKKLKKKAKKVGEVVWKEQVKITATSQSHLSKWLSRIQFPTNIFCRRF